jgi:hypothetical protein
VQELSVAPILRIPQTDPKAAYLSQKAEIEAALARALASGWYILGVAGAAQQFVRSQRATVGQELFGRRRPPLVELGGTARNRIGRARVQRHAASGVVDGRRERVGECDRAVVAQRRHPRAECPGHDSRQQTLGGDAIDAALVVLADGGPRRRATLTADNRGQCVFPSLHHDDCVAADSVHVRFDDVQHERRRHGGVEGIAAALEHGHADRRCDPMRAGHGAERAHDLWSRGEGHGMASYIDDRCTDRDSRPRPDHHAKSTRRPQCRQR